MGKLFISWGVCPRSRALGEGPLLVLSVFQLAKQFGYGRIGKKELGKYLSVVVCAVCSVGTSVSPVWERERCPSGSPPTKGHRGALRGWDEAGDLCSIPGDAGFTGRHPAELGLSGAVGESPDVPGRGPPQPQWGSVLQLCRGFSSIWVKFLVRLERSRVLEHASCRCHSWVIQEINWGLGWEAASKWTLCSALPSAPARSRCQMLRDGAGGYMASTTSASRPLSHASKPVPEPSTPLYALKKTKSNQIRAHPKTRMEMALCGLDDVGCAVLPHALARQQV